MRNWQRWALAILIPLIIGGAQAFEEGTSVIDGLRHGAHGLVGALIALKMTLNVDEK
jgi:hypothetical protein